MIALWCWNLETGWSWVETVFIHDEDLKKNDEIRQVLLIFVIDYEAVSYTICFFLLKVIWYYLIHLVILLCSSGW